MSTASLSRLERKEQGLVLIDDKGTELFLDFVHDRMKYLRPHRGKSELIAKALGLPKGLSEVWDMTAGLCEDAWFLARLGARVRAHERSPLILALVQDALSRACADKETAGVAEKLTIMGGDSIELLKQVGTGEGPEVIYLDPMFQFAKEKSALPRKEMQIFRSVVGADEDALTLLKESLRTAKFRVVVKRPIKEKPLLEGVQHRFEGTSIRFDLYQPQIFRESEGFK